MKLGSESGQAAKRILLRCVSEMNFQGTIGTLLILSGVAVACIFFGPDFVKTFESMDGPSVGTVIEASPPLPITSPPQLIQQTRAKSSNNYVAATKRPSLDQNPSSTDSISKAPVQEAIRLSEHSNIHTPEQSEPVLSSKLSNLVQASKTTISIDSDHPALSHSVLEVLPEPKSQLEERDSAKYVKNRYVVRSDVGRYERAEPMGIQFQNSDTRVGESIEVLCEVDEQLPLLVQRANYESRVASPAESVVNAESISTDLEVQSIYHPARRRLAQAETLIEPALQQIERQTEIPQKVAPTDRAMGISVRQPVLERLRVNPQVELRAREHIEYGESLARRNSHLAAREEFTLALLLVAKSHNAHRPQSDPNAYSDRLALGLTALDEVADFVGSKTRMSRDSVLQQKVRSHKTRLIPANAIGNISRTKAVDYYCGFAQSQLEQAVGYSTAGSAALHALGKIESRTLANSRRGDWTGQARALVFFRAAMSCSPANAVCSNDLGVLLHDIGRLKEAEHALKVSLGASPTQMAWANLAAVHSEMASTVGTVEARDVQLRLARLAAMQAEKFGARVVSEVIKDEQWATLNEFHNNAAFPNVTMQPVSGGGQQTSKQSEVSAAKTLLQKVRGW